VSLSPVTSAWNESAVTYATIPTLGSVTNGFTAATAGQYVTLDVTSLVQGWITAPATNFGFALTSSVANLLLDSKENDETGHAPRLDVTIVSMGATGATGAQGPQGIQGIPGAQGATGAQGAQGIQGVTGAAGLTGATGATGATGTLGVVTNWSSSATYQVGEVVFCAACSANGSSYIALATNTNVDPPTQPTVWNLIARAGATGPAGPIGATGVGATGPAGATGPTGPTGPAGGGGSIYGDGSDGITAGVCAITSDTNWNSFTVSGITSSSPSTDIQCTNFTVSPGVTLYVPSGTEIRATGTLTIKGTISVFPSLGSNPYALTFPLYDAAQSANSGNGTLGALALAPLLQRKILHPGFNGGGNGGDSAFVTDTLARGYTNGMGGGSFVIYAAGAIDISGSIQANGGGPGQGSAGDYEGGGAGGILVLASKASITNTGTLSANGGQGNASGSGNNQTYAIGGGGGGGIIHLLAPSIAAGTTSVTGGAVGSGTTASFYGGGGGGACGGAGGNGTINSGNNGAVLGSASAGAAGVVYTSLIVDPATLILP
jgi:Collagen triple helix repeat (20 copies)